MFDFLKKNKKIQTDTGFRDDYTETDELALPGWARTTTYILTSFLIVAVIWASVSKIDKIVKARGKFVSTGHEIVIRPMVDSIVKRIDVRIGQVVKKGQKILTLDPTFANSDLAQVNIRIANAKVIIYRIQCELDHVPYIVSQDDTSGLGLLQYNIFTQRRSEFNSKLQSFDAQISTAGEISRSAGVQLKEVGKQVEYANQIKKMRQEVFTAGYDTKLNLLQAENEYSRYKNQAETLKKTMAEQALRIQRVESEKNAFVNDWRKTLTTELSQNRNELDTYLEQQSKAQRYSELGELTVPEDSMVLEIGNISVGSVVKTGEVLVKLAPLNDPIEAEVHISPGDVGFIRQADLCKVKIDAFPFQKHGGLKGTLKSIGENTLDPSRQNEGPYYLGRITLESIKLKNVPKDARLIPGMSLSAEIVVGKRTVMSYLLYPMMTVFDESIREP